MTKLENLNQYNQLFNEINTSLTNYNKNLRNELFEIEDNETHEEICRKGETIFDCCEDDLINLGIILEKENEILQFFEKCKENKTKLIQQKNNIITKLVRIQKTNPKVTKEEWLNYREEWNKKREESCDERNRRECEEMLEEMKEEKIVVEEMTKNMMKIKEECEEIIRKGSMVEIKKELNDKVDLINNNLKKQIDEEFVKKNEIVETMKMKKNDLINEQNKESRKQLNGILNEVEINKIEEWTDMKCCEILFDSYRDNWNENTSVFGDKIIGKKELIFIIQDTNNNTFGVYVDTTITHSSDYTIDSKAFVFSLRKNGKNDEMKKCIILSKYTDEAFYLENNSSSNLFKFGNYTFVICKENQKSECYCREGDHSKYSSYGTCYYPTFQYDKTNLFYSDSYEHNHKFTPKRIIVIQMK